MIVARKPLDAVGVEPLARVMQLPGGQPVLVEVDAGVAVGLKVEIAGPRSSVFTILRNPLPGLGAPVSLARGVARL